MIRENTRYKDSDFDEIKMNNISVNIIKLECFMSAIKHKKKCLKCTRRCLLLLFNFNNRLKFFWKSFLLPLRTYSVETYTELSHHRCLLIQKFNNPKRYKANEQYIKQQYERDKLVKQS